MIPLFMDRLIPKGNKSIIEISILSKAWLKVKRKTAFVIGFKSLARTKENFKNLSILSNCLYDRCAELLNLAGFKILLNNDTVIFSEH